MKEHVRADHQTVKDLVAGLEQREVNRRSMLRGLFMGLGAACLPSWVLRSAVAEAATGGLELDIPLGPLGAQDFGALVEKTVSDPLSGVRHQLYAPEGFDVRLVMRADVNPLTHDTTGTLGHRAPDGGAVYPAADGGWIYVSNSEINPNGSVSALRFDATGTLIDYRRICTGTRQNCAGGQTPWGTWITCEEVSGGYAWECDPLGTPETARRLDALGARNGREAVAIDPINHVVYQTLDTSSGKFVRFVSNEDDLEVMPSGVVRQRLVSGVSERLYIPEYQGNPGFANSTVPNTALGSAALRNARPIQWLEDAGNNGTNFNGGEGIWYYEVPAELRTIPAAGTKPTRGVIFFASKNDNRIWAIDIENQLIELIYDTHNGQAFDNLRNADGSVSNFNQVDNVFVTKAGDVLVAEDGSAMRLAIMVNNRPAKLLLQITAGNSEIAGPAFTPDGSRLYFSSQRGPSGPSGTESRGAIYEVTIPSRFRAIQKAAPFAFQVRKVVAPGALITSEFVTLQGFEGPLLVSVSEGNEAQLSVDAGAWTSETQSVVAGQAVRVRHRSAHVTGQATETRVQVGLESGVGVTSALFKTLSGPPAWLGTKRYVAGDAVTHDEAKWVASWWTQNQEPGDPYGPWQEHAEADDGGALWTPSRIFLAGDVAEYAGRKYTAKWWTRNQEPGDVYGPWALVAR